MNLKRKSNDLIPELTFPNAENSFRLAIYLYYGEFECSKCNCMQRPTLETTQFLLLLFINEIQQIY